MTSLMQFMCKIRQSRVRLLLGGLALALIAAIWVTTFSRIRSEYQLELQATMRANANLTKAFEEHVRRNLQITDDILLFLKNNYETHGQITPSMLNIIDVRKSVPILHVSVVNSSGKIIATSRPDMLDLDVSDRSYYDVHRGSVTTQSYFSEPVFGKVSKQWLFHVSRRLNNPDGTFGGAVTIGIDPAYFSNFYRQMNLGNDYAITLIGADGIIRMRQSADRLDIGGNASNAPLFRHVAQASTGSYVDISLVDHKRRIYSYSAMSDYPLILSVSVLESEALTAFSVRRTQYYWEMAIISFIILGIFVLLLSIVVEKEQVEEELRVINEQLESKVKERTEELEALNRELQQLSVSDGLTGIANRRYFDDYLQAEWAKALRIRHSLAIIMADIDFFKDYNDTYGHQLGDECVVTVASVLQAGVHRPADLVARYGGEEFVIILPDTDQAGGLVIAEKLRAEVERLTIEHKSSSYQIVTVSLGVAAMVPEHGGLASQLIELADQALYEAKKQGRNRVSQANYA